MYYAKEIIEEFKRIDLHDVVGNIYGYNCIYKKPDYSIYKNNDRSSKVQVSRETDSGVYLYRDFYKSTGGTIIQFVQQQEDCEFIEALDKIKGFNLTSIPIEQQADREEKVEKKKYEPVQLHKIDKRTHWANRGIKDSVLKSDIFSNIGIHLFETSNGYRFENIGIPMTDLRTGEEIGMMSIGKKSVGKKGFKHKVKNSDFEHGFYCSNMAVLDTSQPINIILAESGVDLVSYHQLYNPENPLYIGTFGEFPPKKTKLLNEFIRTLPNPKLTLALDNDAPGIIYDGNYITATLNMKYGTKLSVHRIKGAAFFSIGKPPFNETTEKLYKDLELFLKAEPENYKTKGQGFHLDMNDVKALNKYLISYFKHDAHIQIHKSKGNDHNEDLMIQIKENQALKKRL